MMTLNLIERRRQRTIDEMQSIDHPIDYLMAWFWSKPEALDHIMHQLWFIDGPDGGRYLLLPCRDDEAAVPTAIFFFFFPAASAMLPP
jgi:hypothetical protein